MLLTRFVYSLTLCVIVLFATRSPLAFAHFHSLANAPTTAHLTQSQSTLLNINTQAIHQKTVSDFSTLLQRRILQILAHQLIDDQQLLNKHNVNTHNEGKHKNNNNSITTHYQTKTFSVSINTMNTSFYHVRIKDNLQQKETLIRIPR